VLVTIACEYRLGQVSRHSIIVENLGAYLHNRANAPPGNELICLINNKQADDSAAYSRAKIQKPPIPHHDSAH